MLTGSIVALITPMDYEYNICQISLKKIIEYHISNNTNAIVLAGTTGEYATLTYKEYINLIKITLELVNKRIPIIVSISSNSTSKAVRLINYLNNYNISGFLTVTPYYNTPTQEGLFQHFKCIAENSSLPQILYNVPHRTGCDLLPETIGRLSEVKNIIGVKEATKDLSRVNKIKELVPNDFILLSGDDSTALDFIQLGGHGVISVTANVAAYEMSKMCEYALADDFYHARIINQRLSQLHDKLFIEPNPIPIKWACKRLGLISTNLLRLPMTKINDLNKNLIFSALKYANLIKTKI